MPSVKNRWVKPGGSFNYTEGQKVLNRGGTTLPTLCAVRAIGVAGGVAIVEPCNGTDANGSVTGRILFLRHAIPDQRYGVGTPWIIARGTARNPIDTNGALLNAPVYIRADAAIGSGLWTLTEPAAVGETARIIGYVIEVDLVHGAISFANTNAI